jgi:hypothetical protein
MFAVLDRMEKKFNKQEKDQQKLAMTSKRGADAAAGSFNKLEHELKGNEKALKGLTMGTKEFTAQKRKVDELRASMVKAKGALKGNVAQQSGAANVVSNFTTAISGTLATLASVGTIAASLKSDLEKIARKQENERLAEVEFGTVMASKTISNLAENERGAVRPLAINLGEEIGENPAAVAQTIGDLVSTGATDILEASEFLREAAKAFPQDLAASSAIARAAITQANATGNRNAKEVIGGTVQAQAVSLTTSPEQFAKAFGSNIAAAVAVQGMTPEKAKEEAAIFSLLETRSPEVAADAQRSFMSQIEKFVPERKKENVLGGIDEVAPADIQKFLHASVTDRQNMLQANEGMRNQFVGGLQETGRSAIRRRLAPTAEDAETFARVQAKITGNAGAAKQLRTQQEDASVTAAFGIAQGQREAQKKGAELRTESKEKFTGELARTKELVAERTRTGLGGTIQHNFEGFGHRVEQFVGGRSRGDVLESSLRFQARNEGDPFVKQQVERIDMLKKHIEMLDATNKEGNQILRQMLQAQGKPNPAAPVRPKQQPLPAATVP